MASAPTPTPPPQAMGLSLDEQLDNVNTTTESQQQPQEDPVIARLRQPLPAEDTISPDDLNEWVAKQYAIGDRPEFVNQVEQYYLDQEMAVVDEKVKELISKKSSKAKK
eukprot:UN10195